MLKCDLKDLKIVSDEVARFCGFHCQIDLYVYILCYHDDLERANCELEKMENFYYPTRKMYGPSVSEYIIKTGNYECIYGTLSDFAKRMEVDYPKVLKEYPDFNDFVKSLVNAPSPTDFSRFQ